VLGKSAAAPRVMRGSALLHDMHQFVGEQGQAVDLIGSVRIAAENNVRAVGKSAGSLPGRQAGGGGVGMDPHRRDIDRERRFQTLTQ